MASVVNGCPFRLKSLTSYFSTLSIPLTVSLLRYFAKMALLPGGDGDSLKEERDVRLDRWGLPCGPVSKTQASCRRHGFNLVRGTKFTCYAANKKTTQVGQLWAALHTCLVGQELEGGFTFSE